MSDAASDHWERVYSAKAADAVSWYQPTPASSLNVLERHGVPASAALIDVGGGASSLVDHLLDRGWTDLAVLDLADSALAVSRDRLGPRAGQVEWLVADITRWRPGRRFDVWHDRAVFHFLTEAADREAYRSALLTGLNPGGWLIMATFAPDGPERCSGLPVRRYDAAGLAAELGPGFDLAETWREVHVTPGGAEQKFNWAVFRKSAVE